MPTDPALLAPRVRPQAVLFVSLSTAFCLVVADVAVVDIDVAGAFADGTFAEREHFLLLPRYIRNLLMTPAAVAAGLAVPLVVWPGNSGDSPTLAPNPARAYPQSGL